MQYTLTTQCQCLYEIECNKCLPTALARSPGAPALPDARAVPRPPPRGFQHLHHRAVDGVPGRVKYIIFKDIFKIFYILILLSLFKYLTESLTEK